MVVPKYEKVLNRSWVECGVQGGRELPVYPVYLLLLDSTDPTKPHRTCSSSFRARSFNGTNRISSASRSKGLCLNLLRISSWLSRITIRQCKFGRFAGFMFSTDAIMRTLESRRLHRQKMHKLWDRSAKMAACSKGVRTRIHI
jgi:hypothetical protein